MKSTMPIIAASARTAPATAPAMAPPLMSLMFTGEDVVDDPASVAEGELGDNAVDDVFGESEVTEAG